MRQTITAPPSHADGLNIGESAADKVGLYGVTPVAQPAAAAQAAVTATAVPDAAGAAPTAEEFNAAVARLNALVTLTNSLRAGCVSVGVIKGGA